MCCFFFVKNNLNDVIIFNSVEKADVSLNMYKNS